DALAAGRPFVLIVGSDSPTLPAEFMTELSRLDADVVLGPTRDGGFYAIGCRKIHPEMFAGVTWSSTFTLTQTIEAARWCGLSVSQGLEWFDIDEPDDLYLLFATEIGEHASRVLTKLALRPSAKRMSPWLSIVIPTLNESSTIGRSLEAISQ